MSTGTVRHLSAPDLALLAGGDAGRIRTFSLGFHLRACQECREKVAEFRSLRDELAQTEMPELNWNRLSAEMRANIHLGLEAGECVRSVARPRDWTLQFAAAITCILVLAAAGFFLKDSRPPGSHSGGTAFMHSAAPQPDAEFTAPILQSTTSGVELRTGSKSLTLLNQRGAVANQTVSAQGAVRSRFIDGETGAVTINNVYLE